MFASLDIRHAKLALVALLGLVLLAISPFLRREKPLAPLTTHSPPNTVVVHAPGELVPGGAQAPMLADRVNVISLSDGALIDLNRADAAALERLPRIGPAMAQRIVADREAHGLFRQVSELDRVPGIGSRTIELLAPFVTVGDVPPAATQTPMSGALQGQAPIISPVAAGPVAINRASSEELQTLRRVGPVLAGRIMEFRARQGRIRNAEDLLRIRGIGPKFLEENRERIIFD